MLLCSSSFCQSHNIIDTKTFSFAPFWIRLDLTIGILPPYIDIYFRGKLPVIVKNPGKGTLVIWLS